MIITARVNLKCRNIIRFVFLLAMLSCSSTQRLPDYISTASHPAYPSTRYMTAVGSSSESFESAEASARARLVQIIRSKVESECVDIAKETLTPKGSASFQSFDCTIISKGSFAFNELIKIDPKLSLHQSRTFYAFAYLDRFEANEVLSLEYQKEAKVFREKVKAGLASEYDIRFAPIYREAASIFARLWELGLQIRTIRGGMFEELVKDTNLFSKLVIEASRMKGSACVFVSAPDAPLKENLLNAVTMIIEGFNIKAIASERCSDGLILRLKGTFQCIARFGVLCSLSVTGDLCLCNTASCTTITLPNLRGHHVASEESAKKAVFQDNEGLEGWRKALFDSLSLFVPL